MGPLESATVTISYVHETVTKGGLRRFEIGAQRTNADQSGPLADRYLSFTTLNQWKASLCSQSKEKGFPLSVTFRSTGYFDSDLVSVEPDSVRIERERREYAGGA